MHNKELTCTFLYNHNELKNLISQYCKQAKKIVLYCNHFLEKNTLNIPISDYDIAKHCYYSLDKYLYDILKASAGENKKVQVYDYAYKAFLDANHPHLNIPNLTITPLTCDTVHILDDFVKALEKSKNQTISQAITQNIEKKGMDFLITCIKEKLQVPLLEKLRSLDEYQKLNEYRVNEQIELLFDTLIQNIKDIYATNYAFVSKQITNAFLNIVNIFNLKSFLTKTHPLLITSDIAFESWKAYENITQWNENKYSYAIYNAIIKLLLNDIGYIFTVFENTIYHYTLILDDKILFDFSGFGATNFQSLAYQKQDLAILLQSSEAIFKDFQIDNFPKVMHSNAKEELILYNKHSIKEALQKQMSLDQNRLSYIESPYCNSIILAQIINDLKEEKNESCSAKNFLFITNAPQKYNAQLHKKLIEEIFKNTIIYPDTIEDEKQNDILVKAPKDYETTLDYSNYKIDIMDNEKDAFVLSLSPFIILNYRSYEGFKDAKDEKNRLLYSDDEGAKDYSNFINIPSNRDKIHNYNYLQTLFVQANNKKTFLEKQKQYFQEGIDCIRSYVGSLAQTTQANVDIAGNYWGEKVTKKSLFTVTDVILLALTYYVIKHFYSSIKTDYQAWWKLFTDYESIQIEGEESIPMLPKAVFVKIEEEKIPLCFSKQQKTKLTGKTIFCIEELVDYLEQIQDYEVSDEEDRQFLSSLEEDENTQVQDETLRVNLEQLNAFLTKEKEANSKISDELDDVIKDRENNTLHSIAYKPQKTLVVMMDVFLDKFFPFADFLRGDQFKFAKLLSKTLLHFLTLKAQKALYESIGVSYLLFLMTQSNIQIKRVSIPHQEQFHKRLKRLNKLALLELCHMQRNKNKYEAIMLVENATFKELNHKKGFKDITSSSKKQILGYKYHFTLKTLRNLTKESFLFLPQAILSDVINQLWVVEYEKNKKEYERLQFLNFTHKYNPPYVLKKKPTKTQQGFISYPLWINNTFISFNFTSMFAGGKLQTGSLGEKDALFVYQKDLSGTKRVRNYLVNKLFAYLCLDELRSKTNDLKSIEDLDFFNTYSYSHDLAVKPRLLKLKHEKDFLIPNHLSQTQKENIQAYNKKLQAINHNKAKQDLYEEYRRRCDNGLTENSLNPIDAYHLCMDYLEDIDNDIFNTEATNNQPHPLKHRNFLRALDAIGQNNIKALYAGINDNKNILQKEEDKTDKKDTIVSNENKEEEKEPPKIIGRLATTIIMKNGLYIG